MTSDIAIRAEGLGKKYVIGHSAERERYVALRDVIARNARNLGRTAMDLVRGRPNIAGDALEEFWALKDVSFEIKRGEVVGVIGRNGAGKSTLLKILSRITEPTEGRVEIHGRVSSLLEVGTGFHPELTGRENIFLNGAILGMTHAEIRRRFDEIVAFAEVDKFLDTPVKRYSSGMYVRLAFAVAAHLEPEILVVDEVLAVGDAEFQKKCLGKMGEVAGQGRTVLFVSHNMAAIASLCETALYLQKGQVAAYGGVSDVMARYAASARPELIAEAPGTLYVRDAAVPIRGAAVTRLDLFDGAGTPTTFVESLAPLTLRVGVSAAEASANLSVVISMRDALGDVVAKFETEPRLTPLTASGDFPVECRIEAVPLVPGQYYVAVGVAQFGSHLIEYKDDIGTFSVTPSHDATAHMSPHGEGPLAARHTWRAPEPVSTRTSAVLDACAS